MNTFENALKKTLADEVSITENGAVGFKTSGHALVDINFATSSLRDKTADEIQTMFSDAYQESPLLAIKWMFMLRDVRGGMGERRSFRICYAWLSAFHHEIAVKLIPLVAAYGRFDDLFYFGENDDIWNDVFDYVDKQLSDDIVNMKAGKPISLLAKWLPSINTSSLETVALARRFCKKLELSEKQYRKTLSALRKHLNVVEQKMSAKEWNAINYEQVPSRANIKYKNAFLRNDEARRREFLGKLEKGEAKINSATNFPCDIVYAYPKNGYDVCRTRESNEIDPALEAMWKALPNYAKDLDNGSTIVVADSSGSMTRCVGSTSMTAMEVAYSLAIYFAERLNGPFKDKTITFSCSPEYLDMSNARSLAEKLDIMYSHSEVADTNIEAVFDLILETATRHHLKQEDIPSNVLIASDMEFNAAQGYGYANDPNRYAASQDALFKAIERKWSAAGYKLPRLVFWNIASRTETIPLTKSDNGVALVSGYSPAVASMVFSSKLDPYEVLVDALNAGRYAPIEDAVKDLLK